MAWFKRNHSVRKNRAAGRDGTKSSSPLFISSLVEYASIRFDPIRCNERRPVGLVDRLFRGEGGKGRDGVVG